MLVFTMADEKNNIEFETSITKLGKVTLYAKIDQTIAKHLGIIPKQEGIATVVNGKIILDFTK